MSTYLSNNAISREIDRLRRNDPESTIYGVWNAILNLQFPVAQGYITRPQDQHTFQSGEKGFSDLHTFHYRDVAKKADKFLVVQCKRAGFETRGSVWAESLDQMNCYLAATHKSRPHAKRPPVYGIIAIGRWMRVYKYDDEIKSVDDWIPDGMEVGKIWHLIKDHADIQVILDQILQDH